MWPLLLHYLSPVSLALAFLIMNCRPRQLVWLFVVLVAVIARDDQRSRAERAIEVVWALSSGRERARRPDRTALPPGSSP
jgi:hypothetical protein